MRTDPAEKATDIKDLSPVLDVWVDHQRMVDALPGISVAVAVGDSLAYTHASGASPALSSTTSSRLTPASPLFAGSVTKVMTAALVLKLVELKTLSLDDEVNQFIPEFRPQEPPDQTIRIRHLLRHSSGLPREVPGHPYWVEYVFPSSRELVVAMNESALAFAPGTETQYSNAAYGLLGVVVERATKMSLNTLVRTHLLEPAGITNTTMRPAVDQRASVPLSSTQRKRYLGGRRSTRPVADTRAMAAAFGALTNASDLARFGCFLASSRNLSVLSQTSRDLLFYGERNERTAPGRGLGMKREQSGERVFLSHTGWYSGYRTHLAISPEENICVAVQATADDAKVRPLAFALLNAVLDRALILNASTSTPLAPEAKELIGTYGVEWLPDFDLVMARGSLALFVPSNDVDADIAKTVATVDVKMRTLAGTAKAARIEVAGGPWDGASMEVMRSAKGHITGLRHSGGLLHFERRPSSTSLTSRGVGGSGGG